MLIDLGATHAIEEQKRGKKTGKKKKENAERDINVFNLFVINDFNEDKFLLSAFGQDLNFELENLARHNY